MNSELILPQPCYQVCGKRGGLTLTQYYRRQRKSRLNMLTEKIANWWRPLRPPQVNATEQKLQATVLRQKRRIAKLKTEVERLNQQAVETELHEIKQLLNGQQLLLPASK